MDGAETTNSTLQPSAKAITLQLAPGTDDMQPAWEKGHPIQPQPFNGLQGTA
jgi:hypothetical protein